MAGLKRSVVVGAVVLLAACGRVGDEPSSDAPGLAQPGRDEVEGPALETSLGGREVVPKEPR